jgi:lipid II:glycine glycyltransferase (peptidoglycan interpeptide bridge formation enzyme)
MAYVPWGPERRMQSAELAALAKEIKKSLPASAAFIRFDLPWEVPAELGKPFTKAPWVQPPDTVVIDLLTTGEEILSRMKSKWRYNIGLADKKGVAVRCVCYTSPSFKADLASYFSLYRETAERDGIGIHGEAYYEGLFEEGEKTLGGGEPVDIRLYLASAFDEESGRKADIAGIITLFRKDEAVYLYGASANRMRNLMAPYALQWQAIRDAKEAGCSYYDLYGIPPSPPEEDPDHPMAGLYRFKTGFGGRIIRRPGCYDYTYRPIVTGLYRLAEKARTALRNAKKRKARGKKSGS